MDTSASTEALLRAGPVLVVVEGSHDVSFLVRVSHLLRNEPGVPDLAELERIGRLIFIPTGGDPDRWACRFAPLQLAEWHLWDREVPPLTEQQQQTVEAIRQRPGCMATLTSHRAVENYVHSEAIKDATGLSVIVEDHTDVPMEFARKILAALGQTWDELHPRARKRLRNRVKRILNTTVVERMTCERLRERDPEGEVIGWLRSLGQLVDRPRAD